MKNHSEFDDEPYLLCSVKIIWMGSYESIHSLVVCIRHSVSK